MVLDSLGQVPPSLRLDIEYIPQRRVIVWCQCQLAP